MILHFADISFTQTTHDLVWGLPVGIPLLFFTYSLFILIFIGLFLLAYKKQKETAFTLLASGAYFLLWFLLQKISAPMLISGGPIDALHLLFTACYVVASLIFFWRARSIKKYAKAARTMIIISTTLASLYMIEIVVLTITAGS